MPRFPYHVIRRNPDNAKTRLLERDPSRWIVAERGEEDEMQFRRDRDLFETEEVVAGGTARGFREPIVAPLQRAVPNSSMRRSRKKGKF